MSTHEIPLLASSNPDSGAQNVSPGGDQFEINLEDPIQVPSNATSCTVEVQKATIWNVVPNVIAGSNDQWYTLHAAVNYQVTIPQGLYDLSGLQAAIDIQLQLAGAAAGLITFIADDSTQKAIIRINQAGTQIDLTPADTPRDLLGFNSQLLPPGGVSAGVENFVADNTAAFNTINSFLVHSDIVSRGIRTNNRYNQTIDEVLIDVRPGSQIVQKNFIATRVPAEQLIGATTKLIKFWLTDEQNRTVNTSGEFWTALVVIRFVV